MLGIYKQTKYETITIGQGLTAQSVSANHIIKLPLNLID